jgi:small redox-active disulfide protein 2
MNGDIIMKIEILGTGCAKCKKTEKIVREAVKEKGLNIEIEKVEEMDKIIDRGVMMTPAVVIDGEIKIVGRVPTKQEINQLL